MSGKTDNKLAVSPVKAAKYLIKELGLNLIAGDESFTYMVVDTKILRLTISSFKIEGEEITLAYINEVFNMMKKQFKKGAVKCQKKH